MQPHDRLLSRPAPVQPYVSQQEFLRKGRAIEGDAGKLARFAVRTIATNKPVRADDIFSGLVSQGDLDVGLAVLSGDQLGSPSHLALKFSQSRPQLPFDLGLPDDESGPGMATPDIARISMRNNNRSPA